MNRIEILVCTELFNIRKRKEYPKQVIRDVYNEIRSLFGASLFSFDIAVSYDSFKELLKKNYRSRSQIEYKYVCDLLDYLDYFSIFQRKFVDW